jgi:uncharacterized protein YcbK (DUF882 family)
MMGKGMDRKYDRQPDHGRRSLLRAAALLSAGGTLLVPHLAAARAAVPRQLAFRHLHTNEKISLTYYADGRYLSSELAKAARFLRDFRSGEVYPIDPALLDYLYAVQLAMGSRGVFEVISGYRSPATNRLLRRTSTGVARRSLHTRGKAIDVRLTGVDTAQLRDTALSLRRGGVGYYRKSDFVHLDTGRVRSW